MLRVAGLGCRFTLWLYYLTRALPAPFKERLMKRKLPSDPQTPRKNDGKKNLETSVSTRPLSLDERLEAFDPAKHGGEHMAVKPVGREVMQR